MTEITLVIPAWAVTGLLGVLAWLIPGVVIVVLLMVPHEVGRLRAGRRRSVHDPSAREAGLMAALWPRTLYHIARVVARRRRR